MRNNIFGRRFKELRESKGLSQKELARRLGHVGNSYVRDIEMGVFLPPREKYSYLARALGVPTSTLATMAFESKMHDLGIEDQGFVAMFKNYRHLSLKDRAAIMRTYQQLKHGHHGSSSRNSE